MRLSDLKNGEKALITKVRGYGAFRKRVMEMGFVRGKEVMVIKNAPLRDPIEYQIMGYEVSLRRTEAALVEVEFEASSPPPGENGLHFEISIGNQPRNADDDQKTIHVALIGNPNSGKTTLFNQASGAREHVGNYSGVTVESKMARVQKGDYTINLYDLPGTYSLTAFSPEEIYVRDFITKGIPDLVINVLDGSNLERNLLLTTQLIDMDIRVIAALNMFDELNGSGARLDYKYLGDMLGVPFMPCISSKGVGLDDLFSKVIEVYEDREPSIRHIHIHYGKWVEDAIKSLQEVIRTDPGLHTRMSPRFLALKLLEDDKVARELAAGSKVAGELSRMVSECHHAIETQLGETPETVIMDARYGFISGALKETYTESPGTHFRKTEIIDTFLTHKAFGFPIFLFFMLVMFYSTFKLGAYPQAWIEWLVAHVGLLIDTHMPDGMLKDLIADGMIAGVGGVIVFLPNILILFMFISFMEDTGYMARAAFIMDRIMHKFGLHGKSFIPLIMGFGCNVPAIMATRTIENRNDRLLTMLINPFMSCSARLPVYILIIGAFFPANPTTMLFLLYLSGILLAVLSASLFKKIFFKTEEAPFVMELPPYRIPTLKSATRHTWEKGVQYLRKMGGVILLASICIWALGYFPRNPELSKDYRAELIRVQDQQRRVLTESPGPPARDSLVAAHQALESQIRLAWNSELQEKSYIGRIGHFIAPVMKPLGFDWRMGVSLLTGISAKEIVVSTLGVLFLADGSADLDSNLAGKLKNATHFSGSKQGQPVFTGASALSFLLFILIYFPCVAVVATIRKESGGWKWALFTVGYTTAVAWLVAFITFQTSQLFL